MILVTGGTGLVGSHLLLDLVRSGKKVRAIYRSEGKLSEVKKVFLYYVSAKETAFLFDSIDWVQADILDIPSLNEVFTNIDYVYHCAAIVSFDAKNAENLRATNIEGTANIVNSCIIFKVKKLPFSEEELLQIKAISKGYSKSKEIIDRFLDNPKVEIGKSVYEDFDRIDLIYKIYKDKLKQLDKIVVTVSSPGFEYVDRDKILVNLKPYLKFPVEISYDFQNQIITKTHSFPTLSSETDFNLNSTEELMSAISSSLAFFSCMK
jgi:hypothetical protein